MASLEDRVARLEGGYDHLATKADLAELKADIAHLESRLIRWMVGTQIGLLIGVGAVGGLIVAIAQIVGS